MARIQIGIQVQPQQGTYSEYEAAWLQGDEMGVDSLWTWDHFFPLYGDANGPHFEGWTVLSTLGPRTRHARVGCLVLSMGYRNPALLANMAKTLDHATGGRLVLGMGAGWFERDYREYGYDFGTAGSRLKLLEQGLETIRARWQQDNPPPLNGTVPILIGGGGEKVTLRIAAQHADLWHGFGSPAEWGRKNRVLDEWCGKVGRDPSAIERTAGVNLDRFNELDDYVAQGATHLIYGMCAPFDFAPIERLLAWRDARNANG